MFGRPFEVLPFPEMKMNLNVLPAVTQADPGFAQQWVSVHAKVSSQLGKPLIMEEVHLTNACPAHALALLQSNESWPSAEMLLTTTCFRQH